MQPPNNNHSRYFHKQVYPNVGEGTGEMWLRKHYEYANFVTES